MLFGLDGVEIGLIIVFLTLFSAILSGFPVAFAIGGAGVISFFIIAALDSAGLLVHQAIDTGSEAYRTLVASGLRIRTLDFWRTDKRSDQPSFLWHVVVYCGQFDAWIGDLNDCLYTTSSDADDGIYSSPFHSAFRVYVSL